MRHISNFLVVCNSATNFFIYWISDRREEQGDDTSLGSSPPFSNIDRNLSIPMTYRLSSPTGVTASRTQRKDSFTSQEVEIMFRTYTDLWCKPDEESGLCLGHRILVRFTEIKPQLSPDFGILENCGDGFGTFIAELMTFSIKNRPQSLTVKLGILGRHHCEMGKERFLKTLGSIHSKYIAYEDSEISSTKYNAFNVQMFG